MVHGNNVKTEIKGQLIRMKGLNDPVYQALEPDVKGTRPITVQFEKYQVTIISFAL
jgi:hypothetical protein